MVAPVGILEGRVGVNQLRPIADEQILELVDIRLSDVPPNQLRARGPKRLDRAKIPRPIDDDGVPGIDQAPGEQIEPLLRTGEDQHALGRDLEAIGNRLTKRGLALGRAMTPDRTAVPAEDLVDRLLKYRRREAIDRGLTGGERQQPIV